MPRPKAMLGAGREARPDSTWRADDSVRIDASAPYRRMHQVSPRRTRFSCLLPRTPRSRPSAAAHRRARIPRRITSSSPAAYLAGAGGRRRGVGASRGQPRPRRCRGRWRSSASVVPFYAIGDAMSSKIPGRSSNSSIQITFSPKALASCSSSRRDTSDNASSPADARGRRLAM
jgi:hypothetical protein